MFISFMVSFLVIQYVYADNTVQRTLEYTPKISISSIELNDAKNELHIHLDLPDIPLLKDGWLKLVYAENKERVVYDGSNWVWYSNMPAKNITYSMQSNTWFTPGVYGNATDGNPEYNSIWNDTLQGYFRICLVNDEKILCGKNIFPESAIKRSFVATKSLTTTKNTEASQVAFTANVTRGNDSLSAAGSFSFLIQFFMGVLLLYIGWWLFLGFGRMFAGTRARLLEGRGKMKRVPGKELKKIPSEIIIPQGDQVILHGDIHENSTYPNAQVLRIYRVGSEYRIEFDQLYDTGVKVPEENRRKILQEIQIYIYALQKLTKARGIREDLDAVQIESYSLEKYGSMLYRLLFSEKIRRAIEKSSGPLIIRTDDHEIPWELLHTGKNFLALERPLAREILFTNAVRINPMPPHASHKLRMLCISNPTGDLIGSEHEAVQLLAKFGGQIDITILSGRNTSVSDIFSCISRNDWDIIHYAGHANFHQNAPDESGLLLSDGQVISVSEIRRTLGGNPLVFLNACMTGKNISTSDSMGEMDIVGLSAGFLSGGARGVLAPLWSINDAIAARFSLEFYTALFANASVGDALLYAKKIICIEDTTGVNWTAFSYYGNPTSSIRNNPK